MKIIIILFLLININLYGYLDNKNYSVKAHSIGNITTANLMNSDTVFYNPALLSYIKDISISFNLFNIFPDIINNSIYTYNLSIAKVIADNGIGIGYNGLKSDNYNESLIVAGYSREIKSFSTGISFKYANISFEQNVKTDPILNYNLTFFSTSVGFLLVEDNYKVGLSIYNLVSVKIGDLYDKELDRSFNIGGMYDMYKNISIIAEMNYCNNYFGYKLGASFLVLKKLLELNIGLNEHSFNFGFSFRYIDLYIDYATQYNFNFTELNTSQMIGVRVNL